MIKDLQKLLVFVLISNFATAQVGSLDLSFNPGDTIVQPTKYGFDNEVFSMVKQGDGKIIVGGAFKTYGDDSAKYIVRLNKNYTIDKSFVVVVNGKVTSVGQQSDGKIIIGGDFTSVGGVACGRIARLNADGSLDNSFQTGTGCNAGVTKVLVQSDDKIMVLGTMSTYNGSTANDVLRLNSDGSLDGGFSAGTGISWGNLLAIIQFPNGKYLVGGSFTSFNSLTANDLVMLQSNGTIDLSFNAGTGFGPNSNDPTEVKFIVYQNENKILVGGTCGFYNGKSAGGLVRIDTLGNLDNSFKYSRGRWFTEAQYDTEKNEIHGVGVKDGATKGWSGQIDGILIYYKLNTAGAVVDSVEMQRFNSTGYTPAWKVNTMLLADDGNYLIAGKYSAYPVYAYNFALLSNQSLIHPIQKITSGFTNRVKKIGASANGDIFVGGLGSFFNGKMLGQLFKLNSFGLADSTFLYSAKTKYSTEGVYKHMIMDDGTVSVIKNGDNFAGQFFNVLSNGVSNTNFYSGYVKAQNILTDSYATSYNFYPGYINDIIFDQRTNSFRLGFGEIFVSTSGYSYSTYLVPNSYTNGTSTVGATILTASRDGKVLSNFSSKFVGGVLAMESQADGKLLVSCTNVTQYNGKTINKYLTRLNEDGTLDNSFASNTGLDGIVNQIKVLKDGKIIIVGNFKKYQGKQVNYIACLFPDGNLDTTFKSGTGANYGINAMELQSDGKILIGGNFNEYDGHSSSKIARLNTDGSYDSSFNVGTGANAGVFTIAIQTDGNILIGGDFTSFNGQVRNRIARLIGDTPTDTTCKLRVYFKEVKDKACADTLGMAVGYAKGGTGTLSYSWTGSNTSYNNTDTLAVFQHGDVYQLTVTDSLGCSQMASLYIKECIPDTITSVIKPSSKQISLYPNPASSSLTVIGSDEIVGGTIKILSPQGQLVIETNMTAQRQIINVATVESGIYLLQLQDTKGFVYTKKWVKE